MTKRQVERKLDERSDELLKDLSPDARLRAVLKATAEEKDNWLTRLRETCPQSEGGRMDAQYLNHVQFASLFAYQAVYDLHTTWLMFEWMDSVTMYQMFLDLLTDSDFEHAGTSVPTDPSRHLRSLYVSYHGYERFATEELDVSLEDWVALHPNGPDVVTSVAEVLVERENPPEHLQADSRAVFLTDIERSSEGANENASLDELAELWYQELQDQWTAVVR